MVEKTGKAEKAEKTEETLKEIKETKETKETKKELEETYRKFLRLYERFAEDRVTITKQGETLGKIIEELKAESSMATEFKHHVRDGLKFIIDDAARDMGKQCNKEINNAITQEVNYSTNILKKAVEESTAVLNDYEKTKTLTHWLFHIGAFLMMITFGFILFKWAMPTPVMPLNDEQLRTYIDGQILEDFWSKIPKKEQQRLRDIGAGKIDPEVNSFEWIKQQHPTWSTKSIVEEFEEQGKQDEQREKQEQKKQQK